MHVPPFLALAIDRTWMVPIVGALTAGLAFFVGWRFVYPQARRLTLAALEAAGTGVVKGLTSERRATQRRRGNTVEVILREAGQPDRRAWVLDRSVGGLCLLVDVPLPEGHRLQVRPRKASETVSWLDVTVRSCRAEQTQFEVGFQFQQAPNYNTLMLFG